MKIAVLGGGNGCYAAAALKPVIDAGAITGRESAR